MTISGNPLPNHFNSSHPGLQRIHISTSHDNDHRAGQLYAFNYHRSIGQSHTGSCISFMHMVLPHITVLACWAASLRPPLSSLPCSSNNYYCHERRHFIRYSYSHPPWTLMLFTVHY
jgi:hypothetical protein